MFLKMYLRKCIETTSFQSLEALEKVLWILNLTVDFKFEQ